MIQVPLWPQLISVLVVHEVRLVETLTNPRRGSVAVSSTAYRLPRLANPTGAQMPASDDGTRRVREPKLSDEAGADTIYGAEVGPP